MKNFVFVYGTLRKGEVRHTVLEDCEFIGKAHAEGYDLYLVFDYPGMVEGSGRVVGEVYAVPEKKLTTLDRIEATPDLFRREIIKVKMEMGEELEVYTYLYNRPVDGLKIIPSGDWKNL